MQATDDRSFARTPPAGLMPEGVTLLSLAGMLLLAVMWGLSIPVTKLGLISTPPLSLTALRFACAAPVLLVFALRRPLPAPALARLAALGALGVGVGQVTQTFGVAGTSASVGTVISAAIPLFIVVFAAIRLKQKVTGWQQLGLLAAFAGIAIVALGQDAEAGPQARTTAMGVVWMLVSSLAVAFYYVWSIELTRLYGAAAVAAWSTLAGFLALLPFAAWEAQYAPTRLTVEALAAAAYLGLVVTVAGLFLWLWLLHRVPARVAAGVQYLQPVVGVAAAAALFGDRLGPAFGAGVALILCGVALASANARR